MHNFFTSFVQTFTVLLLSYGIDASPTRAVFHSSDEGTGPNGFSHQVPMAANENGQKIIGSLNDGVAVLKVTSGMVREPGYLTEVSFGTPPQHFQLLLDTSSLKLFVNSVDCDGCSAARDPSKGYNSSQSSTHYGEETSVPIEYNGMTMLGPVSDDTMGMGNLQIHNQVFQELIDARGMGPSYDDPSVIQGFLGLGSPLAKPSADGLTSPFLNAVSGGLLKSNVFALRLSEPGELIIGDINTNLFRGDVSWLPLTNSDTKIVPEAWQTQSGLGYVGADLPNGYQGWSLEGYTVSFTTAYPYIYLPDRTVMDLLKSLGFHFDRPFFPPNVDCGMRQYMPDIVLNIAGHNFTLTPYDYTIDWTFPGMRPICVSAFSYTGLDGQPYPKQIILGSALLRKYYSIYDLDSEAIGFATLA